MHTLRPDTHWKRFQYSGKVIIKCIANKLRTGFWHRQISRQNQQYWWRGLKIQSCRWRNIREPTMEVVRDLIGKGLIPVSHSLENEILRL